MEESMRTIPLYILVLVLAAATAGAEELTLAAAADAALLNNPEVAAARERAAAADKRLDGGKSHRLPKIGLSESFVYSNNPAEVFAFTLNQGRFDMEEFFMSDPNNPDPLSTFITKIDFELPIYTGGKLSARVGQAEAMATAEDYSLAHAQERVVFETTTAYVNLAKAREHRALLEKARSTTAEHVRLAEKYAEEGVILEADVLQAKVYLSEMDELLTQASNGAKLAQAALNFQMGEDQALPRELAPLPPATAVVGDLGDWIEAAVAERRDLEAARRKLEVGRLEEKATRPGYFPDIAVLGNYALYDDTFFGSNGHSGSVMAVARINLLGGGSNTAARAAARHETAGFEADIRRAKTSLTAATEAVRVRQSRFKQGLDKMIDLLDAETGLREAEMRELVARYDVVLDTHRLRYVSGATLITSTEDSQ
jgi:outer membrane protein TolC